MKRRYLILHDAPVEPVFNPIDLEEKLKDSFQKAVREENNYNFHKLFSWLLSAVRI